MAKSDVVSWAYAITKAPKAASGMVPEKLTFSPLVRRKIEADFSGGHITSDAGLLLLREVDRQHRLTPRLASDENRDRFFSIACWVRRYPEQASDQKRRASNGMTTLAA